MVVLHVSTARADDVVRVVDRDGARVLQTACATYWHASGVRVTILATVHQASAAYYDAIQSRCDAVDGVVFEGIVRPVPVVLASALPLAWQVQSLRLTGDRYLRGDLTASQYDSVRVRDIPIAPAPTSLADFALSIVQAQTDPETRRLTEHAFAIAPRNAAAIASLRHRLARGDQRLVLLYGASHANDLETRLIRELGFVIESREWIEAFRF